ncbi:uncharacterized protein MELLADRAFT_65055 [Melampsora larici-populina 98AG31]|uniref:Alpha-type protein kinase domain-containing protein n=1 Tax=Melampsora larici-populina (strain 98AG31 / pathotype 3-4-7) TaxID=747676 RepID=F4RTU0_MELLP|nr:uncharacterized protein MELLADRAFT_65055 [Melampsora larici-populina 98AG31]EGG04200.1 hypothetical protein MELLADRAFT_65055 [Melampsora larici-populina 98AG31]
MELEEYVDFPKPVPAINQVGFQAAKDIDTPSLWTADLSNSVKLAIRRIYQLANQGIDPLNISIESTVAAHATYDTSTASFPQEYAIPLPENHPAGPDQTITLISWSDALQLRLKIGRRLSLMEPSWIRSFGDVLPEVEDFIRDEQKPLPWSNGVLISLVAQSDDSSLDPSLKDLVFGRWYAMQDIEKDYLIGKGTRRYSYKGTLLIDGKSQSVVVKEILNEEHQDEEAYLTELAVYHLTSCLLERFKIAMFFSTHVTNDQKLLLNTLRPSGTHAQYITYLIEEVLYHPLEVICTTRDFSPSQPESISSDCLSAFVHFTYDYFRGQALVSNIKFKDGLLTGMRMIDLRHKWSWDNPRQDGIDAFISSHICGTACFALDLNPASFKYDKTLKQITLKHNNINIQNKESRSGTSESEEESGVIDHVDDGEN